MEIQASHLAKSKWVSTLTQFAEEKDACSACYGSLIYALDWLNDAGKLKKGLPPIGIGQGYQGKEGGIGMGRCTSCFCKSLAGYPPRAAEIVSFLRENRGR